MPRLFKACFAQVEDQGVPPESYLNESIDWAKNAPREIFAPNSRYDIYSSVLPNLGPWQSTLHRIAVMLESMRVLAGFESSWKHSCGVDTTNKRSMQNITAQETGIFQVSFDSTDLDPSLRECARKYCGLLNVRLFINNMKTNHTFAFEYAARVLRVTVNHNGPVKRREINPWLRKSAVEEFQKYLALN